MGSDALDLQMEAFLGLLYLMLWTFKWKRFGSFVSGGLDLQMEAFGFCSLFLFSSELFDFTLFVLVFDFIL